MRSGGISLSISIREPKHGGAGGGNFEVSAYQYPSENQNGIASDEPGRFVSAYQYPSENQNYRQSVPCRSGYQLINIHQRTKTKATADFPTRKYQLINIHQRTKTCMLISSPGFQYQLINIHQRTKTATPNTMRGGSISLSISIREPKRG